MIPGAFTGIGGDLTNPTDLLKRLQQMFVQAGYSGSLQSALRTLVTTAGNQGSLSSGSVAGGGGSVGGTGRSGTVSTTTADG